MAPVTVSIPAQPARVVVLVSGSGSNLQALLDATADTPAGVGGTAHVAGTDDPSTDTSGTPAAGTDAPASGGAGPLAGVRIVAVGADRACVGLDRARRAGLPTFTRRLGDHADRAAWDRALTEETAAHRPDLVVSAGFMKILGPAFLGRFGGRVVNTHPALLPSFPGAHGVRDALAYGVRVTGCTVHLVDEGVDTGPIIAQATVGVRDEDDEPTLHERIKDVERRLLVEAVGRLARHGYRIEGRKVHIP